MTITSLTEMLYETPLSDWAEAIARRIADERGQLIIDAEVSGQGEASDLCLILAAVLSSDFQTVVDILPQNELQAKIEGYLKANPDRIEILVGTTIIETDYFDNLDYFGA